MRSIAVLSLLGTAAAQFHAQDQHHHGSTLIKQGECFGSKLDKAAVLGDLMDAAMFIWASQKRCGADENNTQPVQCEIDITSAIKSITSVANWVMKALTSCQSSYTGMERCVLSAGELEKHVAGLAAAGGGVYQKCFHNMNTTSNTSAPGMKVNFSLFGDFAASSASNDTKSVGMSMSAPVMCTVDLKNSATNIIQAIRGIQNVRVDCRRQDSRQCASNVLEIAASFSGIGEFLAGVLGQCSPFPISANISKDAICGATVNALVHQTLETSKAGIDISKECSNISSAFGNFGNHGSLFGNAWGNNGGFFHTSEAVVIPQETPRLYKKEADESFNYKAYVASLAVLIPITVVASFFGGRAYSNHHVNTAQRREFTPRVHGHQDLQVRTAE